MRLRLLPIIAMVAALAGCASRAAGIGEAGSPLPPCCTGAERYPAWMVGIADPLAPAIGRGIALVDWRKGHLTRHPDAQSLVMETLRPLDLVIVGHGGRLSGYTIPGHFSHVAMHLGSEAQLRRLGLWKDPLVAPHHAAIRAGAVLVDTDHRGVNLSTPERVLEVDRLVVLRPRDRGPACRRDALRRAFSRLGSRFDFNFDLGNPSRLFCAELAHMVLGGQDIPTRDLYGRTTILPDEIVATAITRSGGPDLRLYVVAERNGWHRLGRDDLAAHLRAAWITPDPARAQGLPAIER